MNIYRKYPCGYYVYVYFEIIDNTPIPYYVGKGARRRAWARGSHEKVPLPAQEHLIVIAAENLTEIGAYALERRLIRHYGREDLKTGPLRNRNAGGPSAEDVSFLSTSLRVASRAATIKKQSWITLGTRYRRTA